jgi:LmbE family N-acetylglucosaminyl deacetylase
MNPRWRVVRRIVVVAISLLAFVILTGLVVESRRRAALYWYDVGRDYEFEFSGGAGHSVTVDLDEGGFVVPELQGKWDTAFLRVTVSAGLPGLWFEPSVEIEARRGPLTRQYFERGARGARYLNLGAMFDGSVNDGERVRLTGHHLGWKPQQAELLLFDNPDLSEASILVLAPHPDDAEIAAFGLYATGRSHVVTITSGIYHDGRYAHLYEEPALHNRLKGRMRTWDSIAVPMLGGVSPERAINLGYFTRALERMHAAPDAVIENLTLGTADIEPFRKQNVSTMLDGRTASSTWESLVEDLVLVLHAVGPDVIVAPHPALEADPDHRLTTVALLDALERTGDDRSLLYLYTNHHVEAEYYPFGPSDALITLPPWFDPALPLDGVVSFPLSGERQIEKLFALEAMHDLRAPPRRSVGQPTGRFFREVGQALEEVRRDPIHTYSYYRRAVRPNELFFVYAPRHREALDADTRGRVAAMASEDPVHGY